MKSWVLITTILFSTPEKDFSGVVINEYKTQVECDMRLQKEKNINMIFSDLFEVKIESRCEEKK